MRVWDIPVSHLCNKHLVAQHHEIHCIASINNSGRLGFRNHPEVLRWRDKNWQLVLAHDLTVEEMLRRGINHNEDNDSSGELHSWRPAMPANMSFMPEPWQPIPKQVEILRAKGCRCNLEGL